MKYAMKAVAVLISLCILTLTVFASGTLSCWYSDKDQIGRWSTSQLTVYYDKLNTSSDFSFYYSFANAENEWEAALGIAIVLSKSQADAYAPIRYYGGTREELSAMGFIPNIGENGNTLFGKNNPENWTYNSTTKKVFNMAYARGYIINDSNNTLNIYMNAATHELGHALGWMGHSTDKNDVMGAYSFGLYKLSDHDKCHLSQVY